MGSSVVFFVILLLGVSGISLICYLSISKILGWYLFKHCFYFILSPLLLKLHFQVCLTFSSFPIYFLFLYILHYFVSLYFRLDIFY